MSDEKEVLELLSLQKELNKRYKEEEILEKENEWALVDIGHQKEYFAADPQLTGSFDRTGDYLLASRRERLYFYEELKERGKVNRKRLEDREDDCYLRLGKLEEEV